MILPAKAEDLEERKIPIMPALRKILDRPELAPDGSKLPAEAYIFGSETDDEMHRRHLCTFWMKTCEGAKVTNLHLHDLRGELRDQEFFARMGFTAPRSYRPCRRAKKAQQSQSPQY